MGICDFHVHSTASDGRLTPTELVNEAAASRLSGFAIADHDTLDGIPEACSRASELDLLYIPGVELSVNLHTGGSAHLLGYFPGVSPEKLTDPEGELQRSLDFVISGRNQRNPEIVHRLQELGFAITMDDVMEEAGDSVVGRPHIAAVMVRKGFAESSDDVFNRYLGSGRPAYVERKRLGDYRAIQVIRQSGGLPVLAHPVYIKTEGLEGLGGLINSLSDAGLAGLEAYYPEQGGRVLSFLERIAGKRKLLLTGGSDFHGIKHPLPGWRDGTYGVEEAKVKDFIEECVCRGRNANG